MTASVHLTPAPILPQGGKAPLNGAIHGPVNGVAHKPVNGVAHGPVNGIAQAMRGQLPAGAKAWVGLADLKGRQALVLSLDLAAAAVSLLIAMWLRFDGAVPASYASEIPFVLALLLPGRLACNLATRIHRWSFRLAGLPDALRVGAAGLGGTLLFAGLGRQLVPHGVPLSVCALEFFLTTTAFGVLRFGPRAAFRWTDRWTQRRAGAARTLIIGTGNAAESLARDLERNPGSHHSLVGFVTEDAALLGSRLVGRPVLGLLADLPHLLERHAASTVLFADPDQSAARIRGALAACATSRARFKVIPASIDRMDRISETMLEDLSLDGLLRRDSIAFDDTEMANLVRSRRALVTGAGGSIGSELCRQLARHGVGELVMVDMNENELYLGARSLAAQFPGVVIHAEVADVREPRPLRRLGERYQPQDVFHAAAHKHVPLMEDAPGEAVKNNVFGTLHVATMAHACGAERFVLISTDKAVRPTSVMGATKRVAELVVRDLGRSSRTSVTVVRFGNVLGSAGSVVPLFRQQIARGGPVTVTHPDCTRYFMTIPEAVGLLLLAGLGGYGDLCILEMGEPVRIADLARELITLSGHVPDEDIHIEYAGLRPGEKLHEELLTEQEEHTQAVRDRITVARSPLPPRDLWARLALLRRHADEGNREGLLLALQALVPTFEVTPAAPPPAPQTESPAPLGAGLG